MEEIDSRWDLAIELLLAGQPKKSIATACGVHRNTITHWLADRRFQEELTQRTDERLSALRLRRIHEITRFVDNLHKLANDVMTAAERNPTDRRAQRAARAWLANYRRARDIERQALQ